jgi:hypothetical protein
MAFIRNTDKLIEGSSQLFFTNQRAKSAVQSDLNSLSLSISSEQSSRQSADSAMVLRLNTLEGNSSVSGSVAKAQKDAQDYADAKIAALVNSAPSVLDTLKELSDALGGDANFAATVAGQIGAVDSKVSQEILDRSAAISALNLRVVALEADPVTKSYVDGKISTEQSARSSAISAEQSARQSADSALSSRLESLEADPVTKMYVDGQVSSLDGRLDVLEQDDTTKTYVDGLVSGLDSRIDILELDPVTKSYVDSKDLEIKGQISSEQSARQSADQALSGRVGVLEQNPTTKSYVDGIQVALDGRLDIIEGSGEGSVAKAKQDAKDFASGLVSAEESARRAADLSLGNRISSLEADPVTKTYVDSEVMDLSSQLSQEMSAIDARIDILEQDPVTKLYVDGKVSTINGQISQEISNRQSAVSGEQQRAQAAEAVLEGKVDTEKGRIDAILSASQADKDSFAEIVSLINSVDAANDSAFAGYVLSNNAALAQEVSDRQAGDNALDSRLDIIEGGVSVSGSVAKALKDAKDYADGIVSAEATSRSNEDLTFFKLNGSRTITGFVNLNPTVSANNVRPFLLDSGITNFSTNSALRMSSNVAGSFPGVVLEKSRDNGGTPDYLQSGDQIGQFSFRAWAGNYDGGVARMLGVATEQHTSSARGSKLLFQVVPNGSASRLDVMSIFGDKVEMYKDLYVNGELMANKSYVDSQVQSEASARAAAVSAEATSRSNEDLTMVKLDGSRSMTGSLNFTGASGKNILWNTDGGGNIGAPGANRPNYLYVKDTGYFGGFLQVGLNLSWASDGSGDIGGAGGFRPNNVYVKTSVTCAGKGVFTQSNAAAPGYTFGGATNSGMYYDTNLVGISVAGSAAVRCLPSAVITDKVLAVNAGMGMSRTAVSTNYTVTGSETVMGVTSTSAARVITLPSAVTYSGRQFIVKDESGSASVSNYIQIAPQSGQTIDGQSDYKIVVPYESIVVYSNGTNWFII